MIFNGLTLFFAISLFWGGLIIGKCLAEKEPNDENDMNDDLLTTQNAEGRAAFRSPLVTWTN